MTASFLVIETVETHDRIVGKTWREANRLRGERILERDEVYGSRGISKSAMI